MGILLLNLLIYSKIFIECFVPGTFLGTEDTAANKTSLPDGTFILTMETDNKQINKMYRVLDSVKGYKGK